MIATLAILAMGAFVFLDPLMAILSGGRGGGGPRNDAVISWDDGELREAELFRMVQMRGIVNHFIQVAVQLGAIASGLERAPQVSFGPATEREVVRTMIGS